MLRDIMYFEGEATVSPSPPNLSASLHAKSWKFISRLHKEEEG